MNDCEKVTLHKIFVFHAFCFSLFIFLPGKYPNILQYHKFRQFLCCLFPWLVCGVDHRSAPHRRLQRGRRSSVDNDHRRQGPRCVLIVSGCIYGPRGGGGEFRAAKSSYKKFRLRILPIFSHY